MGAVALDPTKLLILMVAGGVFTVAGLWLMLRPKPESASAKLELFGLKFEATSAGLLVFIFGAGFLAAPMFIPEQTGTRAVDSNRGSDVEPASDDLIAPRQLVDDTEIEPNDGYDHANQISVGDSVKGSMSASSTEDWFTLTVDQREPVLYVKVLNLTDHACYPSYVHFYTLEQRRIGSRYNGFPDEYAAEVWNIELPDTSAIFIRLEGNRCSYELFTSYSQL